MKLRNPTERMIFLRDEVNKTLVTLKPGEVITVQPHLRQVFAPYVQAFELRWELDDEDLPAGMSNDDRMGTHAYYKKHEDDTVFNAAKALVQSDSAEIAAIWKEHDIITLVPHEALRKGTSNEPAADFLFVKEVAQQEGTRYAESGSGSDTNLQDILGLSEEGGERGGFYTQLSEVISADGPDYLRTAAPEGLEDFGAGEESTSDEDRFGDTKLPDDAPVTISQLQLSTKAQLWEMGDKLGIDATGTKKEIIDRICKYHWGVHYTKIRLLNKD